MSLTVEEIQRARKVISEVRLQVSHEEALRYMKAIPHKGFLKALKNHWRVDGDGNATMQTICWLFCWATMGNNPKNEKTAESCNEIFDEIFDHSYEWFAQEVTYELAKKLRYDKSDSLNEDREFALINQYVKQMSIRRK